MFKIYFSFLLLFSFLNSNGQKRTLSLESGDLVFQNGECGPLCMAINKVTPAIYGQHYSHIGIVSIENDSVFVIEAIGDHVQKNTIIDFIFRNNQPIIVGRLKQKYQYLIPQAISFSEQQIGIPYDDDFLFDNGKYYCSELVYDAFKSANQDQPFFQLVPMTFKAPDSKEFFPGWVSYYKERGMDIPEGKLGCNPGGIGQSDKLVIYKFN